MEAGTRAARFLAIVSRNLDEFFQIRVSGVREQIDAGVAASSPDGLTPREQLSVIQSRAQELVARQMKIFERDVKPRLHAGGVRITDWEDLKASQQQALRQVFEELIFPSSRRSGSIPRTRFPTSATSR